MKIPLKAYPNSAGYDLFAHESIRVMSNSRGLVSTGFKISIPKGFYGQIFPLSGMALINGVMTFNGKLILDI